MATGKEDHRRALEVQSNIALLLRVLLYVCTYAPMLVLITSLHELRRSVFL